MFKVNPVSDAFDESLKLTHIFVDALAAKLVETVDPVFLYLGLGGNA